MNAATLPTIAEAPADVTPSPWPAVLLDKPIAGRLWVTLSSTHPDPLHAVRSSADASFARLGPGVRHAITGVEPEPYDPLRKFSPHVVYAVTAYTTGV